MIVHLLLKEEIHMVVEMEVLEMDTQLALQMVIDQEVEMTVNQERATEIVINMGQMEVQVSDQEQMIEIPHLMVAHHLDLDQIVMTDIVLELMIEIEELQQLKVHH